MEQALRGLGKGALELGSGAVEGSLLKGNEAVNSLFGVPQMVGKMFKGQGFKEAADEVFRARDAAGNMIADKWNYGKIAGSYIGASAMYRLASGGGAFKDRNGNTNIIGVPFV